MYFSGFLEFVNLFEKDIDHAIIKNYQGNLMISLFGQIFTTLISPPGNLIYHLILAFSIVIPLQIVFLNRQAKIFPQSNRLMFGLTLLLLFQVALFLSSALTWQGVANPHIFLPPLDRTVTALSVIWIIWLWSFPHKSRSSDLITMLLSLAGIVLYIITQIAWNTQAASSTFNSSWLDYSWNLLTVFIIIAGVLLILLQRPQGWGVGLSMLNLILLGLMIQLLLGDQTVDYAAPVRLGQICAFPLLPVLIMRFKSPAPNEQAPKPTKQSSLIDLYIVQSLIKIAETNDPSKIYMELTKNLSSVFSMDLCFLLSPPNRGKLLFLSGYDLFHQKHVIGIPLDEIENLILSNIMKEGKAVWIQKGQTTDKEWANLQKSLGVESNLFEVLLIPIAKSHETIGAVLMASPFSHRKAQFREADIYLTHDLLAMILLQTEQEKEKNAQIEKIRHDLETTARQVDDLGKENQSLKSRLESNYTEVSSETNLGALLAIQQESQEIITDLQSENDRLRKMLARSTNGSAPSTQEREIFETELDLTHQKMHHLETALTESHTRILTLEGQIGDLNKSVTDLGMVVDEVVDDVSPSLTEKNINLKLDLPKKSPVILLNTAIVKQIINLLLTNAITITPSEESISLRARLENSTGESQLVIHVTDSGGGLEMAGLQQLFNLENQMDTFPGVGNPFKLKLAKALAESQGGEIKAECKNSSSIYQVSIPTQNVSSLDQKKP
jgi:signal transduction histidine kinase